MPANDGEHLPFSEAAQAAFDRDAQRLAWYTALASERVETPEFPRGLDDVAIFNPQLSPSDALPPLTLAAVAAEPWNAVILPLPENASPELLTAARDAATFCADGEHELMQAARNGLFTPAAWVVGDGGKDGHEEPESYCLAARDRLELIAEREANEQSTTRQDAERKERSGEAPAVPS